jgi:cytochrome c oxidase subunit II
MIPGLVAAVWFGPLSGNQSVLNPVGPDAAREAKLWLAILWICIVVFVAVWAVLTVAIARRRGVDAQPAPPILETSEADRRATPIVIGAVVLTIVALFSILVTSVRAERDDTRAEESKNPISIQVIGHQWWWEVIYPNTAPSQTITTANEIHVPVGVPVVINTASRDVIHSFWAPNVKGKRDLIPGYSTAFWFRVDKPGIYRGQCAEFCGLQHAKMGFYLVAESMGDFQKWEQAQIQPAPDPSNDVQTHGQQVFLQGTCVMCHSIRGTIAGSRIGPDLTHIGSRLSLGAATLPNNIGNLAGWIEDSQHIKPGNRMPPNPLSGDDLNALLAYLTSLR